MNTITIHPDEGRHSGTVILMHGLGDSADGLYLLYNHYNRDLFSCFNELGWRDVAEQWAGSFPYLKFILPTAPTMPVTLNGGMPMPAW